jgi:tetratricopeptide (TPR) repeat protein
MKFKPAITSAAALVLALTLTAQTGAAQSGAGAGSGQRPAAPQPTTAQPPPMQMQMPGDLRAYLEANRTSDTAKKIAALEGFLTEYPNSTYKTAAHESLLAAYLKADPAQTGRILARANMLIESASPAVRGRAYAVAAEKLREAGVLLEQAEEFAAKGLELQREEAAKQTRLLLRNNLVTLGRVYLQRGKLKEAEKVLKEAYGDGVGASDAATALAEMAEKRGKNAEAVEYLLTAVAGGRAKRETREKLEALYRKTHDDKLDGLEEALDARYLKATPNPVKVERYNATPSRTRRVVLAEVFTGASCPPCVAADLAFDAFLERYTRRDVAVLMYHLHIPGPDPMANPAAQATTACAAAARAS